MRLAGRLTGRRGHGKAAFLDLTDRSGRIQLHARKDVLGDAYERLVDLDLGDVIGVEGAPFRTRRGELSAARRRLDAARRSRCARRPTSTTASPTSSSATGTASST